MKSVNYLKQDISSEITETRSKVSKDNILKQALTSREQYDDSNKSVLEEITIVQSEIKKNKS